MDIAILGAGMMGRAIAFDLSMFSNFKKIIIGDNDSRTLAAAQSLLKKRQVAFRSLSVENIDEVKDLFQTVDVAISAVPYRFNSHLAKIAVDTKTHFLDLGGNNTIVQQERQLFSRAKKNKVTIIPDSGLAPGLVSIITRDIVEHMDSVEYVKLRVGGLPCHPQPPLNYQIVFSPYGLINEYVEDAVVLDHGTIIEKKSMTDLESIRFPRPFGMMEAFLTSGGCSTLPYTYRHKIAYLDYKTIRFPGHCEKIKAFLDLGLAEESSLNVKGCTVVPRDVFASLLMSHVPVSGEDAVLLKVFSKGKRGSKQLYRDYLLIDYYDSKHDITAMMRTTGYPVSITAQMIERGMIQEHGVFCPEEIVPPEPFFAELKKRGIVLSRKERRV
ncbi:MAG: saccharopine dehydrogenase C-terminal domain-containing protein [Methanobacteriota archaeon]